MKKSRKMLLTALMITALAAGTFQAPVFVQAASGTVVINEIESDAADGGNDWIEIINIGEENVDISGWFLTDDKELERFREKETTPFADETVLAPSEIMVFEDKTDFDFGLGKEDKVCLYNAEKELIDSHQYEGHAVGTWSRVIGSDVFADYAPTKGEANIPAEIPADEGGLVINEINSSPDDYVEVMNTSQETMDISGYEIRDNSDDHRWKFAEGTTIEAGAIMLVKDDTAGQCFDDQKGLYESGEFQAAIGIGSGDSIRLYDAAGELIDQYSWTEHASYEGKEDAASLGRYPDGTGSFVLMKETPGEENEWYVPSLVINEIESNGDTTDWVEVYNAGDSAIDISGYYLMDNDPVGHADETTPVAEGTVLAPGGYYVFDGNKDFDFGLGGDDSATVYNRDGVIVATYSYIGHAEGVYARIPDGTGDFVDFDTPTKGKANLLVNPVVINEVQSNDPNDGPDWIELANPTSEALDISGLVIKDDDDEHSYTIPEGTQIPAGGFLVLTEEDFDFGLGKNDYVRIFENGRLIQSTTWVEHTNPTWGLYPDVYGTEYRNTEEATPGAANKYADIPDTIPWEGSSKITVFDKTPTFLEDSSGLDFSDGKLYAVDNGTATVWVLDVAKDGTMTFADGFAEGKRVIFKKDAGDDTAAGPDAEGITVDGEGLVYLASERDNSDKGVNYDTILMIDPKAAGTELVALKEWDITGLLPEVSANMGVEAIEWVANSDVDGLLWDANTKAPFDHSDYPQAVAQGVFFVALEDNGHVYAFVLNDDGTAELIADIDSKIGGAMALDYDTYEDVLWVASDNGYNNRLAKIVLNGSENVQITHVSAPAGLDTTLNYEGFAIADASYTVNGERPVYRFQDGVTSGALAIGSVACDYKESEITPPEVTDPDEQKPSGTTDPDEQKPSDTTDPDDGKDNVKEENVPDTGDSSKVIMFALLLIGAYSIGLMIYQRRKTN